MDGKSFDALAKMTTARGRRTVLQGVGAGLTGSLLALAGAASLSAKPKRRSKKDRSVRAAAKDGGKNSCCEPCPPPGIGFDECTAAVRDLLTGECVYVNKVAGTPCARGGIEGFCGTGATDERGPWACIGCEVAQGQTRCFRGLLAYCARLEDNFDNCGSCDNRCQDGQQCVNGQCQ